MSQTNAKTAYGEELQKAQEYLQALQVALTTPAAMEPFPTKSIGAMSVMSNISTRCSNKACRWN